MTDKRRQATAVAVMIAAILVVDQVVKLLVKTNMQFG